MRQNTLAIHSENILPIIKKWLYSSHEIFLRELVANATDAIKKLRVLRECKQADLSEETFEIQIHIDAKNNTLTISDNGIGMSEEEVEKYIAQIAFSGAEEFLGKYKAQSEKDPMIGHFGLGFYSSYMVADKVEIETLSYRPESKPVHWSCDGSSTYEIGSGVRSSRGTDVILHIEKVHAEYLDPAKIRELLNRYCSFMPEPIFFNGQPLKNETPLWMKAPTECSDNEYLAFYRKLYPLESDPIFWVHLNVDYPFRLQGILYFPKVHRHLDTNAPSIRLFCNRVFVTEQCRDFLPDYLTLLRGAIDSPDIPLNVSRSYLQVDGNVRQLGSHISKKISDRLSSLFKTDREKYISHWSEIESLVKLGILQDEKFYERTKDNLIWKSSSQTWTNLTEYLDRAKEKKVYYSNAEEHTRVQKIFLDQGVELLYALSPIDVAVISTIESKMKDVVFQRIDSQLDPLLLDAAREKTLLDSEGKTVSARIASLFQSHLSKEEITVEAKSLTSDDLPGLLLIDENTRRFRDYLRLTQGKTLDSPVKKTFVINTNNALVLSALRMSEKQPELSQDLVQQIYDLARLAQKEAEPTEIEDIITRNQKLLEKLLISQVS